MTKRMKCKLCQSVIEEMGNQIVSCKCGEVTLNGVTKSILCNREDSWIELDDIGREIVSYKKEESKPGLHDLMKMLDSMIKNIEDLPQHIMSLPVSHYDLLSALMLISSIFKETTSHDKFVKEKESKDHHHEH